MSQMRDENAALRAEVARLTAENERLASESDGWRYGHEYQKKIAELATKQLTETRSKSAVFEGLASDYQDENAALIAEVARLTDELATLPMELEKQWQARLAKALQEVEESYLQNHSIHPSEVVTIFGREFWNPTEKENQ